ncbi:hypothetical protein DFH11DRAFT_1220881 [Phellopilus nigrolimitatus]|nr:hypothetical protein DFH11DRAFT_1220881 [Phellopilus nigrolimitatus]
MCPSAPLYLRTVYFWVQFRVFLSPRLVLLSVTSNQVQCSRLVLITRLLHATLRVYYFFPFLSLSSAHVMPRTPRTMTHPSLSLYFAATHWEILHLLSIRYLYRFDFAPTNCHVFFIMSLCIKGVFFLLFWQSICSWTSICQCREPKDAGTTGS